MRQIIVILAALFCAAPVLAQEETEKKKCEDWKVTLSGSVQSDVLIPQEDQSIGTGTYKEWGLTNTYAELRLRSGNYLEAGARLEFTQFPLPGFEKDFKGWGVPNAYVTGRFKGNELTLGSFYDQFGSGLIFRTYEERSLGIDNSLMGGRFVTHAIKGVNFKALYGKQRRYWNWNDAWIWGGDLELNLQEWIRPMQEKGWNLMLGGSFVSKHETAGSGITETTVGTSPSGDPMIMGRELNVPKNVGAFDVRANLNKGGYNLLVEYARKGQDPSFDNGAIFRNGEALLISGSYSKRGASVILQAKRSEDMSFRSRRNMSGTSSFINHLPAFAYQHTYALAALYPYATQMAGGEWAFQGEFAYKMPKDSPLAGRYGASIKLNFSQIRSLNWDTEDVVPEGGYAGTDGPKLKNWGVGEERYYQDVNLTFEKKLSKKAKLSLMYMHQRYNKEVIEGHGGEIKSHIGVAELNWNISRKVALRMEAQYAHSDQMHDQGWMQDWGKDWVYGLVEVSWLPYLMFTLSDQYNSHVLDASTGEDKKQHYFMGQVTFTKGAHRLMVGYGKTRAGYNCSGGVCRWVPASKGCTISYNFSF